MARPGFKEYPQARALSARPGFRVLMTVDLVAHLAIAVWAAIRLASVGDGFAWAALILSVPTAATSLACMGLRPYGMAWRRRLGVAAVVVVLLRRGPFADQPIVPVLLTVWTGIVFVATLLEGKRVAGAVVEATGEEGLGDDPSRHL